MTMQSEVIDGKLTHTFTTGFSTHTLEGDYTEEELHNLQVEAMFKDSAEMDKLEKEHDDAVTLEREDPNQCFVNGFKCKMWLNRPRHVSQGIQKVQLFSPCEFKKLYPAEHAPIDPKVDCVYDLFDGCQSKPAQKARLQAMLAKLN